MKNKHIMLIFCLVHFIPSLFIVPLLFAFTKTPASAASVVTSVYGLYKWLKSPEVSEGKPYVAYGPPATFWVAEGTKRAELRVPDTVPLEDRVGNFLMRRKLRREAENPKTSWLSPGYAVLGFISLAIYSLLR